MTAAQAMRFAVSLALPASVLVLCGVYSLVLWISAAIIGLVLSVLVETLWLIHADEAAAASDGARAEPVNVAPAEEP